MGFLRVISQINDRNFKLETGHTLFKKTNSPIAVNKIKKVAGLPDGFRPLHGLRHVYASAMASSGQVDMYTLQKLLTHKDPKMTQRYAHLRDEVFKRAADVAGDIFKRAMKSQEK